MSPPPQFFGYSWDDGQPLSASADESGTVLSERKPHVLLRPVYINAVEVGFAYHQVDRDRRLHVRGVTIALWYFISRGHQAVALLPHCFKVYADKSSNWTELMHLFRLNLIEFTPGFGPDKYVEVNRMLATRARETGGCVVARSQMHAILDELPNLDKTIEKKLLMPAFNGDDLIFPMDGPLGRNGPTLNTTLRCPPSDVEWGRCSHHQMRLSDQRIWVQRLTAIVPNKESLLARPAPQFSAAWTLLAGKLADFTPKTPLDMMPPSCGPWQPPREYSNAGSDAYYEWRGGTSSHGPFRQVPHNDLLDGSVAPSVSPPSQPIADSATERQPLTPNRAKEVFNQVAAILGWEKAKTVTQRFPHVESVQALIEYAFEQPAQNRSARAPAPESPKTNDNLNAATQTPTTTALSKFNEALPIISASTSVSPATNTTTTTMTSEPEVEEEILLIDFSTPVDAPPASSTSSPPPPILTELQDLHF
ncbi:unnamed protein product, partial [Mesorhabditis spiculigera]